MFGIVDEPALSLGLHVWGLEFPASSLFNWHESCGAREEHMHTFVVPAPQIGSGWWASADVFLQKHALVSNRTPG